MDGVLEAAVIHASGIRAAAGIHAAVGIHVDGSVVTEVGAASGHLDAFLNSVS